MRSIRRAGSLHDLSRTPISAVMTREVLSVRPDMGCDEAAALYLERGFHGGPVVDDDGNLVGFLSTTDLLRELCRRQSGRAGASAGPPRSVGDLMTPIGLTLDACWPVTLAAALMSSEGAHRILVVSESGRLVGLLSALDILNWLARADGFALPEHLNLGERGPDLRPAGP